MKIKINSLDLSLQTRFEINSETVCEYADLMREGTVLPPVRVVNVGGSHLLVDGYHRTAAVTQNGGDEIEAEVISGSYQKALEEALKANSAHGQRRTNADKRRALEVAWENRDILFAEMKGEDENGRPNGLPSSRQLAEVTRVSCFLSFEFIKGKRVLENSTPLLGDAAGETHRGTEGDATTVTSEHLEERNADVRALLKKQKDRFGMPIPEKVLAAFLTTEPKKVAKQLKQIRKFCEKKIFGGDLAFLGLGQQFLIKLDNALGDLKHWTPYCVCRGCHGTGCYRCSDHGFQTKSQYERNPPELKADYEVEVGG